MPTTRPLQPATPARDAFTIHRAEVAAGMNLAYVREGVGGYPLVLVHGYPETKRIWWRNIEPLVEAVAVLTAKITRCDAAREELSLARYPETTELR